MPTFKCEWRPRKSSNGINRYAPFISSFGVWRLYKPVYKTIRTKCINRRSQGMSGHQLRGLSTAQYLLTSAKSRVLVNLKLYKLPPVPVQSCTQDIGAQQCNDNDYKKEKKEKRSFCFTVCFLYSSNNADESLISRARCCVPVLSAGRGNNKVDFFSGPKREADAIHTIHAGQCTRRGEG